MVDLARPEADSGSESDPNRPVVSSSWQRGEYDDDTCKSESEPEPLLVPMDPDPDPDPSVSALALLSISPSDPSVFVFVFVWPFICQSSELSVPRPSSKPLPSLPLLLAFPFISSLPFTVVDDESLLLLLLPLPLLPPGRGNSRGSPVTSSGFTASPSLSLSLPSALLPMYRSASDCSALILLRRP